MHFQHNATSHLPVAVNASMQAAYGQHQAQPRLLYYIIRSNNTTVPLVPADELPFDVRLDGVSRILTPDQVVGMQPVGVQPYTGLVFRTVNTQQTSAQTTSHTRSRSSTPHRHVVPVSSTMHINTTQHANM